MANISINLDSLSPKSFKKTVRHKIKDGLNTFRFLPPFGEESNGYPYRKWNVVWGLADPNSGRVRPFASSSTYEGQCPVFDYLDILKQKIETQKVQAMAAGATESDLKERFKAVNEFISMIRPKTVYAYNASDKTGTVGVLELKATAHKDVLKVMNQYIKDYNQDPTSLNSEIQDSGVWINIVREGDGFDTKYGASKNQIMVKNEKGIPSYQDDRGPLAENISANYNHLAYDLNSIYQKLSYSELKDILVANIVSASATMPELLVEGFGLTSTDETRSSVNSVNLNTVVTNSVKGTSKPSINLGAAEDVDTDDEDLLRMADNLFKS